MNASQRKKEQRARDETTRVAKSKEGLYWEKRERAEGAEMNKVGLTWF
jgi:hypothetical protein